MSSDERRELIAYVTGTVIVLATLGAWLYAEANGIGTGPLLGFVVPVVGALFIGRNLGTAKEAAQQAATQTNGGLEARVKSATAQALAERDAARTRQVQGDITYTATPSGPTAEQLAYTATPNGPTAGQPAPR